MLCSHGGLTLPRKGGVLLLTMPVFGQDDELPSVDFVLDIARAAVLRCALLFPASLASLEVLQKAL